MDNQDRLSYKIAELERRISVLESRTFTIPIVDNDPSEDDPVQVWGFADGRINFRTPDSVVHEIQPIDVYKPVVPTFASDPAASTGWRIWFNTTTGRLRGRDAGGTVKDIGPTTTVASAAGGGATRTPSTTVPKPTPPPPKKSYDRTLTCEWIATFDGSGDRRSSSGDMYYGRYSSTWGRQKIMMGFENFRSQLAGATIKYAELIIESLHTWPNAGTRVFFGTHTASSLPSSYSRKSRENFSVILPDGGTKRFAISTKFIAQLRDNDIDGFTVEQPDDNKTRYGYMDDRVRLRVKYVK